LTPEATDPNYQLDYSIHSNALLPQPAPCFEHTLYQQSHPQTRAGHGPQPK